MGIFRVNASGSKGNSYAIESNGEILLLELGISMDKILKSIDYKLGKVVGVLVSHSHS